MFLLLALPLFIFLPSPWNAIGGFAAVVLFGFEVAYWQRRIRHQKVQTGVETLVGATGEVSEPLAPVGQVRVRGELWEAHSSSDLPPGARVRVIGVNGLTLEVEPVDRAVTNVRSST
jgi:membrane-bound serine protease (ClpP class)